MSSSYSTYSGRSSSPPPGSQIAGPRSNRPTQSAGSINSPAGLAGALGPGDRNQNNRNAYNERHSSTSRQHNYANRATEALARFGQAFIGGGSSSSNVNAYSRASTDPASSPSFQKSIPETLRYTADSEIISISTSPDRSKVLIAGRELLQVISCDSGQLRKVVDLRTPGPREEDRLFFVTATRWGCQTFSNNVAVAGTNGSIRLYSVNVDSSRGWFLSSIKAHSRTVNSLDFSPFHGNILVSGSQDGTIKHWDLRSPERKPILSIKGNGDAIRDVKFSPLNALKFASINDSGVIYKWDSRNLSIPDRKISAHSGPGFAIDWHPEFDYIVSGGRDRMIQVWNMSTDSRIPDCTILTSGAIPKVQWRPQQNYGNSIWNSEVASCNISVGDYRTHIWSLRRKYIPKYVIDEHFATITGIVWKDSNHLWSSSKDKSIMLHNVEYAPQPINRLSLEAFSWSPADEFSFAVQKRVHRKPEFPPSDENVIIETNDDPSVYMHSREGTMSAYRSSFSFDYSDTHSPWFSHSDELDSFTAPPHQFVGCLSLPFFERDVFAGLAYKYQYDIGQYKTEEQRLKATIDATLRNSDAALDLRKPNLGQTWKAIALSLTWELGALTEKLGKEGSSGMLSYPRTTRRSDATESATTEEAIKRLSLGDSTTTDSTIIRPTDTSESSFSKQKMNVNPVAHGSTLLQASNSKRESSLQKTSLPEREEEEEDIETPQVEVNSRGSPSSALSPGRVDIPASVAAGGGEAKTWVYGSGSLDTIQHGSLESDEMDDGYYADIAGSTVTKERLHSPSSGDSKESQDWDTEAEALNLRDSDDLPPWRPHMLIKQIADYYCDEGDTQMVGTLALLLGSKYLPSKQCEEWAYGYMELLYRFHLDIVAAEICKSTSIDLLNKMSQTDTTVLTTCPFCFKPINNERTGHQGTWYCERCGKITENCVLCCKPIKGRISYSIVCGHSGHDECLRHWFFDLKMNECPSGCGAQLFSGNR